MVNFDTLEGYSVTSFQSPLPEQLIKSSISGSNRLNTLETLEEESSLELLPYAAAVATTTQHHHQTTVNSVNSNGFLHQPSSYLLVPSTSILSIREVHFKHGGNYSCAPSNARAGTITIHVLQGKPIMHCYFFNVVMSLIFLLYIFFILLCCSVCFQITMIFLLIMSSYSRVVLFIFVTS